MNLKPGGAFLRLALVVGAIGTAFLVVPDRPVEHAPLPVHSTGLKATDTIPIRDSNTIPPEVPRPAAGRNPVPGPGHTHEPQGLVRFAENDFSRLPPGNKPQPGGLAGDWQALKPQGGGGGNNAEGAGKAQDDAQGERTIPRLAIAKDESAPESPPDVLQMKFPRGWEAGRGPVNWGGWDAAGPGPKGQKSKLYLSIWLKLSGADYENQSVGTKMGFVASGLSPETKGQSGNQSLFFLKGKGKQGIFSAFNVEFHQFFPQQIHPPYTTRFLQQNVDRRPLMTAGAWHHWEMVMTLNDVGQKNGSLDWWIDDTQVMRYNDLLFRLPGHELGFWNFKFNPTWGGMGGRKTRDDFIDVDHIYLSGIPLNSSPDGNAGTGN